MEFRVFDEAKTCDVFHANPGGLQPALIEKMKHIYGVNLIEIIVLPIYKLILNEVFIFPSCCSSQI